MARRFAFTMHTRNKAHFRQNGNCACCGESLEDEYDNGHHVIPNQLGTSRLEDKWLSTADNCVMLREDCHYIVHQGGKWRTGAVAPANYFKYSHGDDFAAHNAWVREVNRRWKQIDRNQGWS